MTIVELKAAAYDCMVQIEAWQKRLAEANQKVHEAEAAEKPPVMQTVVKDFASNFGK